jgi:hypothetical protein
MGKQCAHDGQVFDTIRWARDIARRPSRARAPPSTRAPSSPLHARDARAIHARIRAHRRRRRRAPRHRRRRRPRPIQRDLAQTLHRPSQSHPTTTRAPTTRTPHHTAHRSHQKPIHRPRASRIAAPARARRQSASFPSSSIANDYSERRASSHRKKKRTTNEPRGAATHAGLFEPCFTLAPRRDNERDAVSGAVTDAMADIVRRGGVTTNAVARGHTPCTRWASTVRDQAREGYRGAFARGSGDLCANGVYGVRVMDVRVG